MCTYDLYDDFCLTSSVVRVRMRQLRLQQYRWTMCRGYSCLWSHADNYATFIFFGDALQICITYG